MRAQMTYRKEGAWVDGWPIHYQPTGTHHPVLLWGPLSFSLRFIEAGERDVHYVT